MTTVVRQGTMSDAAQYLELLKIALGDDYPDRQIYDPSWSAAQFGPASDIETWIVEKSGRLGGSVSFLPPLLNNTNPIANLGRMFVRPESYADGTAEELLKKVTDLTVARKQHAVTRVPASDYAQQELFEKAGYACVGYQPFKHMNRVREGMLFYVRPTHPELLARLPLSDALPQIKELSEAVLANLKIPHPISIQDGTIGYPLQTEVACVDASIGDFERFREEAQTVSPTLDISGTFNMGFGYLRTSSKAPFRSILARRGEMVTAGLAYNVDPFDRCVRLVSSFSRDDLSMGTLLREALKNSQEQLSAVYVEMDILVTGRRMLKTAEQLGFVPIAYLAEFFVRDGLYTDVVKMVKLNMVFSTDNSKFTPSARAIVEIIDRNFQDQKVGVAIVNLLSGLPIFEGLGDGELRKIARLFVQRLFRAGERIFSKGDSGKEAYVVMRGAVDILFEEGSKPIASIGNGQIFGELAFLDGAARGAIAVANQPSILLIIQRTAFNDLVHREPHLGTVVMRNIATELSNRLRRTNLAVIAAQK
ncbi:MAG: cyclic nucleotide-binding domain-containing protein [Verrucomicrobia bacterium]|nr:cyclic nucleotide-binding domain-containing protein [Verrucomicrobiota bacterium]